ncbi:TFIIB-type zinc ribbon-containing protein [Cellulomonas palmilytica]|uniref:TFIIB-type zinc ribbon-containing protein n=1 Tax=Cellulomonas palmilytica TaxID=2608402 RepID=UPI001F378C95|nr:zf-TFIIB domain-containing protein [Cellulomonas palmilytica]UJP40698.1 zf-TFIIB domain-containing protein [Cellulomonas palmilytica]
MKCPVDQAELVMSERQGVEIDYCPTCRGVWLDRGELDKILDRAAAQAVPGAAPTTAAPAPVYGTPPQDARPSRYDEPRYDERRHDEPRYDERRDDDRARYGSSYDPRYGDPRYRRKKKRDSWLGDLLDFD